MMFHSNAGQPMRRRTAMPVHAWLRGRTIKSAAESLPGNLKQAIGYGHSFPMCTNVSQVGHIVIPPDKSGGRYPPAISTMSGLAWGIGGRLGLLPALSDVPVAVALAGVAVGLCERRVPHQPGGAPVPLTPGLGREGVRKGPLRPFRLWPGSYLRALLIAVIRVFH